MNIYLILLFTILANARMTSLITNEIGPFYVFVKLRYIAGYVYTNPFEDDRELTLEEVQKYSLDGSIAIYHIKKSSLFAELFTCIYCMSIWSAMFFILCFSLFIFPLTAFEYFISVLACSYLSILLIEKGL